VDATAPGAWSDRRADFSKSRERSERAGRTTQLRTAKPCGPGTRCWCQVGGGVFDPTGSDSTTQFADDGGKTNSSPGSARNKPLKPFAQGGPGCLGCTCGSPCALSSAQGPRVPAGTRPSLRPLISRGHDRSANLGRIRAASTSTHIRCLKIQSEACFRTRRLRLAPRRLPPEAIDRLHYRSRLPSGNDGARFGRRKIFAEQPASWNGGMQ
jgi:hypothetical protein